MFKTVATAGFALFSMFFGSGNIIFPIDLGCKTLSSFPYAGFGFVLTAVFVPILGFLGMIFSKGDYHLYFDKWGKIGTFTLSLLMLSLMGPFGIVPRCIGVSFGGFNVIWPELELWMFSLIFSFLVALCVWKPNKVVSIIGNIITPFKLGGIIFLILIGLWFAPPFPAATLNPVSTIISGITLGYQTMDLLASFFFAASIVQFIRQSENDPKRVFKSALFAGLLGSILLIAVYIGFLALGASYGEKIGEYPCESLLTHISGLVLGDAAIYVVSFTIAVSCLATATILTKLFVEFLQIEVLKNRLSYHVCVGITLMIVFVGSLFGFKAIVSWIGFTLSWMYPVLIVYAVYKLYEGLRLKA